MRLFNQSKIDALPKHPADPNIACGENLDRDFIIALIRERHLLGAIFQNAVSPQEITQNVTLDLQTGFRAACQHFTQFFFSTEKGHTGTTLESGIAVVRGIGVKGQSFGIETPGAYEGTKTLRNFLPSNWLIEKVKELGSIAHIINEYGFHIFHAFANAAQSGYARRWHTHEDIGAHLTLAGAGLEWLPSDIRLEDARKNPDQFENRVQSTKIGDLFVLGRVIHRSSHQIPQQGQFALLAHGPYDL